MASRTHPKDPAKSDLIQRLISTPSRASYLDQKANRFAFQIPGKSPAHAHAHARSSAEEWSSPTTQRQDAVTLHQCNTWVRRTTVNELLGNDNITQGPFCMKGSLLAEEKKRNERPDEMRFDGQAARQSSTLVAAAMDFRSGSKKAK